MRIAKEGFPLIFIAAGLAVIVFRGGLENRRGDLGFIDAGHRRFFSRSRSPNSFGGESGGSAGRWTGREHSRN